MHLIDTSICVAILRGKLPRARQRFRAALNSGVAISSISVAELYYGIAKSRQPQANRLGVESLLTSLVIVPFQGKACEAFGVLRSYLERRGQTIGRYDLLIAAQAVAENAVLVTNNTREFSRVPSLVIEDWL